MTNARIIAMAHQVLSDAEELRCDPSLEAAEPEVFPGGHVFTCRIAQGAARLAIEAVVKELRARAAGYDRTDEGVIAARWIEHEADMLEDLFELEPKT